MGVLFSLLTVVLACKYNAWYLPSDAHPWISIDTFTWYSLMSWLDIADR